MSDGLLTISRHGVSYRIHDPGGRIGSKLAGGIPYEHRLLDEIHARRPTGTALDIGAHVGNHSLYLAAVCGLTVYAVEPNPTSFARLVDNVALNPEIQVTPMCFAAGAELTRGRINPDMSIKLGRGGVPVCRIDDVLDLDDLAVVKIDVEGMEPQVLDGMRRHLTRCQPIVYTEAHTGAAEFGQRHVLAPLGYDVTGIIQMGSTMLRWEHR